MPKVVVAASETSVDVAIIDFTSMNAAAPPFKLLEPGFGLTGSRITLALNQAVAASVLTGEVRAIDDAGPAAPRLQGKINTAFSGIGAVAVRANRVPVGEC